MKKIYVKLNQKYKSFDEAFETELEGNLIILSGINGSGKSQFLNILYGKEINISFLGIPPKEILSDIKIDDTNITSLNIEYITHKNNLIVAEIVKASSTTINSSIDQAYNYYKNFSRAQEDKSYQGSWEQLKKVLGDLYVPNSINIPEDIFRNKLRDNKFIWKQDDSFSDIIGELFYNHASDIAKGQQNAGKINGPAFDPLTLGKAPWTELNELFENLKLEYRFKDNFEINHGELTETPLLFQIDDEGNIIKEEYRELKNLSDGEKTIISLCFNSLKRINTADKKILLLDEFDAVLNPSLIESFFIVIKRYYLDKGIIVILTTHSPATIALAPENTSYYEVYKKNIYPNRILPINKEEYSELKKANKQFYDKIDDQAGRIKELEAHVESEKDTLIITEGKTDWKYILKALEYFHSKKEFLEINSDYFYRYGTENDVNEKICNTTEINELGDTKLKAYLESLSKTRNIDINNSKIRIGIFDSDNNSITILNEKEKNIFSFKIEPNNISTEFLFSEKEIKTKIGGYRLFIGDEFHKDSKIHLTDSSLNLGGDNQNINKAGKKTIIESNVYNRESVNLALPKEKFAQAIFNGEIQISDESWENFRHIFENISRCFPAIEENES